MKALFNIIFLAMLCLVSGCASTQYQGADAGTAVVSIGGYSHAFYHYISIEIKRKNAPFNDSFSHTRRSERWPGDFNANGSDGKVHALTLEPGDYEITGFSATERGYPSSKTAGFKIKIPFTIKAGETVYLGSFLAGHSYGQNLFGDAVSSGFYIGAENKAERDLEIAKKQNQKIKGFDRMIIDTIKSEGNLVKK